jgi:hypothetical protein
MIWPFKKKKAPSDIDIFKSFARAIFDEVIAGDDYAGKVFRAQSAQNIREFWNEKCQEIESWLGDDPAGRGKRLREHGHSAWSFWLSDASIPVCLTMTESSSGSMPLRVHGKRKTRLTFTNWRSRCLMFVSWKE